ncbi:MAG: cytochrome c oxidase subunit II [Haloarculaceae archaeon]
MHIHKYEKLWLGLGLLLIVGFIATITYGAVGAGVKMVDESGEVVNPNNLSEHPEFSDPGVEQVGENEYDVHVVSRQFAFSPGTASPITVPANSTINFYVTSADVIHGFSIVGTNANTMVIPGEVAEITVEAEEPGKYGIVCHEYCGQGHHDMAGTMEVVPQDEYNGSEQ